MSLIRTILWAIQNTCSTVITRTSIATRSVYQKYQDILDDADMNQLYKKRDEKSAGEHMYGVVIVFIALVLIFSVWFITTIRSLTLFTF